MFGFTFTVNFRDFLSAIEGLNVELSDNYRAKILSLCNFKHHRHSLHNAAELLHTVVCNVKLLTLSELVISVSLFPRHNLPVNIFLSVKTCH